MLLAALSLLLVCLLALLFFKDYKTRSRMKLSQKLPGPMALPLLGNFWGMIFYYQSKLREILCLAVSRERRHGTLRPYDFEVRMS